MAAMTASILFLIFLCTVVSGRGDEAKGQNCAGEVTWSQADNCCKKIKGNLGSVGNKSEMNQILEYIRLHNMTSSWVNLKRQDMNKWRWIDGESGDVLKFLEENKSNGSCAWFNLKTRRLEPGRCSATNVGSICQIKDPICKEFHRRWIGRQHNGICYLHFCERLTWHEARAYCHTWDLGYTMALVKHNDTMEELVTHKWSCDRFWVGLRKEEWLENNDTPVIAVDVVYQLWNPDETKDTGRCGRVRMQQSSLLFEPTSCQAVDNYVCLNVQNGMNAKPQGMATHYTALIVSCSIGGLAVFTGILAGMFLWRRKRMLNGGQRPRNRSKTEDDADSPLQGEADHGPKRHRLQCLLADTLLALCDKIELWGWHDERVTVPLDETFVDLVLVRTKHGRYGKKYHRLASYAEMFTKVTSGQRGQLMFLSGEPGVGKSTISRRMCVDWSKIILVKKTNMTNVQMDILGKFKYLIPIILRDVKEKQELVDVIREQLMLERTDAHELYKFITDDPLSTLFLLDGCDEYREKTSTEITSLLHREHFPYAYVIVTSRHSSSSHITGISKLPETKVLLRGFSPEGVREYVRKAFNETSGKGKELQRKIETSEDLINLSRYPAVLLLMCCLWEETNQLATTITGFYNDLVKYSCCRFERKYILNTERHKYANIINYYCANLMKIGEIATEGMTVDRQELTFPSEKAKELDETTWKLGFLKKDTSTKGETLVSFVHKTKTVMEWFVAYYIVKSEKSKQEELLIHFCSSPQAFRESAMIVTFCAALGGRDIVGKIETIIQGKEDMWKMQTSLQLSYISEHNEADLVLPQVMELNITDKYPDNVYIKYLSVNAEKLVELSLTSGVERNMRLLQYLNAPSLTRLSLSTSLFGSRYSVHKSHVTQGLDVTLTKFPIQTLKVELFNYFRSDRILYRDEDTYDDDGHDTSPVNRVDYDGTSPGLLAVIRAVPRIQTMTELEFHGTSLTGLALCTLTEYLPCTKLITLTFSDCDLASQDVLSVVDKLPECQTLINLLVRDRLLDDNIIQLINNTGKLAGLRVLQLECSNYFGPADGISGNVTKKIKQTLSENCPNLEFRMQTE